MTRSPYDPSFYDQHRDGARRSARVIVPLVLDDVHGPKPVTSVVDVGCGRGTWLSVFRERGIVDVHGIDGGHVNLDELEIPRDRFTAHDLSRPFTLARRFDLVVCLEVAEHVPAASAAGLVESLTRLGSVVLFSGAIPAQGGERHVNEQWPDYWAALFASHGFVAVDGLRRRIWQNDDVEWWYAQNALLFVERARLAQYPALAADARDSTAPPLALVHPRKYLELLEWIRTQFGA